MSARRSAEGEAAGVPMDGMDGMDDMDVMDIMDVMDVMG